MQLLGLPTERLRVSVDDATAADKLGEELWRSVRRRAALGGGLIALCIGTDRSTGDSLGPLTGSFLQQASCPALEVIGTLDSPVHASNLAETVGTLETRRGGRCVIAVDACLGRLESVGKIALAKGAVLPGAGVNKTLPAVGDYHLVGIVNISGFMDQMILQNTRLNLVYRMAGVIAEAVATAAYRVLALNAAAGRSD